MTEFKKTKDKVPVLGQEVFVVVEPRNDSTAKYNVQSVTISEVETKVVESLERDNEKLIRFKFEHESNPVYFSDNYWEEYEHNQIIFITRERADEVAKQLSQERLASIKEEKEYKKERERIEMVEKLTELSKKGKELGIDITYKS